KVPGGRLSRPAARLSRPGTPIFGTPADESTAPAARGISTAADSAGTAPDNPTGVAGIPARVVISTARSIWFLPSASARREAAKMRAEEPFRPRRGLAALTPLAGLHPGAGAFPRGGGCPALLRLLLAPLRCVRLPSGLGFPLPLGGHLVALERLLPLLPGRAPRLPLGLLLLGGLDQLEVGGLARVPEPAPDPHDSGVAPIPLRVPGCDGREQLPGHRGPGDEPRHVAARREIAALRE